MAISFVPNRIYSSIFDLKPEKLKEEGVKTVFADLDNTLIRYSQKVATPEVRRWKEELEAAGITLFLVSNSRKPTRAKRFGEDLGIGYIGHAGKPKARGFRRAMELTDTKHEEAVMIGDQIFTDILCAHHMGIRGILVPPIKDKTNLFFRFKRWCERPFIRKYAKEHGYQSWMAFWKI